VSQEWNCAFKQPETLDTAPDSLPPGYTQAYIAKLLEESISRPTQTDYAMLNTNTTRSGTTISTTHCIILLKAIKSNDIPILEDKPPKYILLVDLPFLPLVARHSSNPSNKSSAI
jgi:hypothetical protein